MAGRERRPADVRREAHRALPPAELGRLEIDVTIDDPKAYTQPWTVRVNQRLLVDGTDLIEFVCLENQKFNGAAIKQTACRRWISGFGTSRPPMPRRSAR